MTPEPGPSGWRDPGARAAWVMAALAAAGFVLIGLAWRRAVGFSYVPQQAAPLVAGGLGLSLVGFGVAAWGIQVGRRQDAESRQTVDRLLAEATDLAQRLASSPPRRAR